MDKRILNKEKLRKRFGGKRRCCNPFGVGVIGKANGEVISAIKIDHRTGKKTIIFRNEKEIKKLKSKIRRSLRPRY